ncbi:MAG: tyrosine-type recombinase/integrase, partial [Ginsengibacter sp.]
MQVVTVKPLQHRGLECIGIYFEKNALLQQSIQKEAGARWSKTNTCWYIPCNGENYLRLKTALEDKAELEITELKKFLLEKKRSDLGEAAVITGSQPKVVKDEKFRAANSKKPRPQVYLHNLSKENKEALQQFKRQLLLKAYSQSTIRTYENEFRQFLQAIKNTPADHFSVSRLKDYFHYCYSTLHLSENTLHSRINALKFYYEQVLGRDKFFWEIPRPKKHLILPKVLGEEELRRLFEAANNLKHKAILFTAYSAGLRVSEVINLRLQDIDRGRKQLFVYCSKGKKDRYVSLSPLLLDVLENYYRMCHPKPANYLFEGDEPGEPYSIRSAQNIFHNAKVKAGISKTISFHGLRHRFATHMLEKGVDVKYIKEILGHFNIKTTERYLHIKREMLVNIKSPMDD